MNDSLSENVRFLNSLDAVRFKIRTISYNHIMIFNAGLLLLSMVSITTDVSQAFYVDLSSNHLRNRERESKLYDVRVGKFLIALELFSCCETVLFPLILVCFMPSVKGALKKFCRASIRRVFKNPRDNVTN